MYLLVSIYKILAFSLFYNAFQNLQYEPLYRNGMSQFIVLQRIFFSYELKMKLYINCYFS